MATVQKSSIKVSTGNLNPGGPIGTIQLSLSGLPGYYAIISVLTAMTASSIRFTNGAVSRDLGALAAGSIVYVPQGTDVTSRLSAPDLEAGLFSYVIFQNS